MKTLLFSLLFLPMILQAQEGWKNIGPVDREIQHMAVHGDLILCAASTVDGDRLFRSTDAGKTWSILPSGVRKMAIIPDGIPTIVGSIPPNRDFLISTDMGETWDTTGTPPPGDALHRIYIKENVPGLIFAVISFGVSRNEDLFRSTDYGRTWTHPYDFPRSTDGVRLSVGLSPTTPDIYVNADTDIGGQYFYHSPDDGVTWEYVNLGEFIVHMVVDPEDSDVIYAVAGGKIIKSTNGGYSWFENYPYHALSMIYQVQEDPDVLFVLGHPAGSLPGLSISENRGKTWRYDSSSLSLPFLQTKESIHYEPIRRRLYLQTRSGIYIRENILTTVTHMESTSLLMLNVYPQPAHQILFIKLLDNSASRASVRIFNPLGRLIRILPVETQKIVWNLLDANGSPVPNGVYLCVLSKNQRISSQRIIVLR